MKKTLKIKYILICFALLAIQNTFAQITIKGNVKNDKEEKLQNINILVYVPNSKTLIAFAVSDPNGNFQTKVNSPTDSLDIVTSSVNYEKGFKRIANASQFVQFTLKYDTKQLDDVLIKAKPIITKGDTISYLVSSFAGKEDMVIEDVLRKMPGIEIEEDGKILYQGLPLSKFYVEGLDLMDGRYRIISKNLPHRTVSTVEILENHQPVKILEKRVISPQAALNLKLKKDITTTGTASVGSGFSPLLWEVNMTPMVFCKKFQFVSSYQSNNSGNDVVQQINLLTLENYYRTAEQPNENPGLLKVQSPIAPGIKRNRYHDNNVHLFNLNALFLLNNDFQLRTNFHYVNDHVKQEAEEIRQVFIPSDTLVFNEKINSSSYQSYFQEELTLNRNVKNNFLKNKLKVKMHWDKNLGQLDGSGELINQSLQKPYKTISNRLKSINSLGEKLITLNSYFFYDHSPHHLTVKPGRFAEALNNGDPYNEVSQEIDQKRLYLDHSFSLTFPLKHLSFSPEVGLSYQKRNLQSNIAIDGEPIESTDFVNDQSTQSTRLYLISHISYKRKKFDLNFQIPFNWRMIRISDKSQIEEQKLNKLFIDPGVSVYYTLNAFWKFRSNWNYSTTLGNIDNVNYGYILQSHQNLSVNDAPISETKTHAFSSFISFRNPIASFFNSLNYLYNISDRNILYSRSIKPDGTSLLEAVNLPNKVRSHSLRFQSSKYVSTLKSTFSITTNITHHKGKSLINDELFNTSNTLLNFIPEIYYTFNQWLNMDYSLNMSYTKTYLEGEKKSDISLLKHKVNVFFFPKKDQSLSLSSEYYRLDGDKNFFADIAYQYSIKKPKLDFNLSWTNIFNNKTYTRFLANESSVWESVYKLRPSQIIISVKFRF